MKNKLGIEVCCENCGSYYGGLCDDYCCRLDTSYIRPKKDYQHFRPSEDVLVQRIKELQMRQFTEEEAEKVETFLTHGYKMMVNKNKKIFSKLKKMKSE